MRYFFDTEFIEDGKTIDIISIGIVAEDGRKLYLESTDCDLTKASNWVKANVIPRLHHDFDGHTHMSREGIADAVLKFVGDAKPEFWAYYAAYDWVVMCQLFGTMMDLPKSWPMYCRDVKQLCDHLGNPTLPKQIESEHNALADAQWTMDAHNYLTDIYTPTLNQLGYKES